MSNYHCSEQMHLPKWIIITDGYKIVYLPSYALYIFNSKIVFSIQTRRCNNFLQHSIFIAFIPL